MFIETISTYKDGGMKIVYESSLKYAKLMSSIFDLIYHCARAYPNQILLTQY
jgi:hypothetical protein